MQKAGPKSDAGRHMLGIAYACAHASEHRFVLAVPLYIRKQREIVSRLDGAEMLAHGVKKSFLRSFAEDFDSVLDERRRLLGQRARHLILASQFLGRDFAGFHIRLIKGIDAQNGSSN